MTSPRSVIRIWTAEPRPAASSCCWICCCTPSSRVASWRAADSTPASTDGCVPAATPSPTFAVTGSNAWDGVVVCFWSWATFWLEVSTPSDPVRTAWWPKLAAREARSAWNFCMSTWPIAYSTMNRPIITVSMSE
jgi:hypothetical protein